MELPPSAWARSEESAKAARRGARRSRHSATVAASAASSLSSTTEPDSEEPRDSEAARGDGEDRPGLSLQQCLAS